MLNLVFRFFPKAFILACKYWTEWLCGPRLSFFQLPGQLWNKFGDPWSRRRTEHDVWPVWFVLPCVQFYLVPDLNMIMDIIMIKIKLNQQLWKSLRVQNDNNEYMLLKYFGRIYFLKDNHNILVLKQQIITIAIKTI